MNAESISRFLKAKTSGTDSEFEDGQRNYSVGMRPGSALKTERNENILHQTKVGANLLGALEPHIKEYHL
jgi:hypothetical protein